MKIDRAGIERLVPHAGAMCLLDAVTQWSPDSISCTSALEIASPASSAAVSIIESVKPLAPYP